MNSLNHERVVDVSWWKPREEVVLQQRFILENKSLITSPQLLVSSVLVMTKPRSLDGVGCL